METTSRTTRSRSDDDPIARVCACGCARLVGAHATYRPGHDARHVGIVAREAVARSLAGAGKVDSIKFYAALDGRPALQAKAIRLAQALIAKEGARANRETRRGPKTGTIRVGRWTYPVRTSPAGKPLRNEKRDGTGSWVPVSPAEAKTITWD